MSFITDLFSSGASSLVDSVGNAIDKNTTTTAEQLALENEQRKAEHDYNLANKTLDVEVDKAILNDKNSARVNQTTIQTSDTASWLSKNIASLLAMASTIFCFTLFYILVFRPLAIDETTKDIVIYILGVLSALLTQVYSFYFGSSAGSKDKSETIKNLSK